MKAVMLEVPEQLLEERRRRGADRWDEMWEGVLHMVPPPSLNHQDLEGQLYEWLRTFWVRPRGNRVFTRVGVAPPGGWPHDYRVPDLSLLTADRFDIERETHLEGAPAAVIEIRSPGDETSEKLPFFADLEIPEVWVVDRDTRRPEVHVLTDEGYELQPAGEDGWIHSAATGIDVRAAENERVALRIAGDDSTARELPEN
jgi:Uma2 family endonuclease